MDIRYRPAIPTDLPQCADLFLESLADMRARHNLPPRALPQAAEMLTFYQHVHATGMFHIAESRERIAAFACAILRDRLWFLSGFWARPQWQRQNIGMPALRGVWSEGQRAGATHFFVWSSIDLPAMAAYMKMGMLPGCQILSFEGIHRQPAFSVSPDAVEPLDPSFAMDLDQTILGTRRAQDHSYFSATGAQGRQVVHQGERIGYFYLQGSQVGPAAWREPAHAEVLLSAACREAAAASQASEISMEIPGMTHAALNYALKAGLRLKGSSNLLMSAPFGRLEQYLPSGPGLF